MNTKVMIKAFTVDKKAWDGALGQGYTLVTRFVSLSNLKSKRFHSLFVLLGHQPYIMNAVPFALKKSDTLMP